MAWPQLPLSDVTTRGYLMGKGFHVVSSPWGPEVHTGGKTRLEVICLVTTVIMGRPGHVTTGVVQEATLFLSGLSKAEFLV